jgi:hypothetical protein
MSSMPLNRNTMTATITDNAPANVWAMVLSV